MKTQLRCGCAFLVVLLLVSNLASGSAYNARPKLVVIIIVDQLRGDYLERYRDQFGSGGFRLFLDHGAVFTNCHYDYASTFTAPGHATLSSGTYSNGHGIFTNDWWDTRKKRMVSSVEDDAVTILGSTGDGVQNPGASPHNLLASTLGDELKLATQGKARVFGIGLKDRSAILPAGWAGDGAYWIDKTTGVWLSSSYYRSKLPAWVDQFNHSGRADRYWNREWKDANGRTLRTTARKPGALFYEVVGHTAFANEYELEFVRELITQEKLGSGPATDLLVISISAVDMLGHEVGPDSPQLAAMILTLDRQLAGFFDFLGKQFGLGNLWVALSADHGVAPLPSAAEKLRIPDVVVDEPQLRSRVNATLSSRLSPGHPRSFVRELDLPLVFVSDEAFSAINMKEGEAEQTVGTALPQNQMRGYITRAQLEHGNVPMTSLRSQYLHSYSPYGGWYLWVVPPPFLFTAHATTGHGSPYSYDTHVPLAFFGPPFQAGTYRTHTEPVDLAATLASLLGINAPTHAVGRVLTEALTATRPQDSNAPGAAQ